MTISEALDELRAKIMELDLDSEGMDDEDLIIKALYHLVEDATFEFNELEGDEDA